MNRRNFLTGLSLIPIFPLMAYAKQANLTIGIFPGTGTADMPWDQLRAATMPFARALAESLGMAPELTTFRTIKNTVRSLGKGRLDLYFVPPTVAVAVLDRGYVPLARVKDPINSMLVRRKDATTVTTVALPEKESLPDVLGRYTLKRNQQKVEILNLKSQEEVIMAMERDLVQAGALGAKLGNELVAKGAHEIWYPMPTSPGFTLVASARLTGSQQDKIGAAAAALKPEVIQTMQKAFVSKIGSFVVDKQADFKTVKLALKEAGY